MATPPRNHGQMALPLEPLPAELMRKVRQWWQERPWWHQRYPRPEDLLACPERRALVMACARCAVMAQAAGAARRRRTKNT